MSLRSYFLLLVLSVIGSRRAQVLTPPYFNLAEGRRITATSTCGEEVDEPELYCKLVGANSDKPIDFNVIQGQLCDYCDPNDIQKKHPPQYAIDGSERWWQSPPLSRGMDFNEVNLTIDLGQLFQVAYVVIKMANSPRPGIWTLERSLDNGKSYTAWQYFADNDGDCERYFGSETLKVIGDDDDVICTTRFSKVVPLEGGEIFVSLLNDRPSAKDFFNSSILQEFTRATNVRLRLIRTKTLLGHLMSVARQDPTVTRRYFYSIKDISIGGRCVCNGHARVCDIADPDDRYQLQCRCQHDTCGAQCEECCPGFIQKKWRPASYTESFVCEPCNCFGHSNECVFDEEVNENRLSLDIYGSYEGGGVCQNCHHNTEGINCGQCVAGYYRPYEKNLTDTDVCQPCQCRGRFYTGNCALGNGLCECRKEFLPPYCDACNVRYYDYPDCKPCDCHKDGTVGEVCEVGGGQCPCKENYVNLNCDQCASGYYNFSVCSPCNCDPRGSLDNLCDIVSGQCKCQNNYGGLNCDRCEHGYYDLTNECKFCKCDARGTVEEICDKETGNCLCSEGFSGNRCDNSAPGFWGYPLVQDCGCHGKGSSSNVCDASGKCACLNGYSGRACDQCSPGFFNFPNCEPCNCDQAGSIGISCDVNGNCQCRYNFDGVNCDKCRAKFYNFPLCEECNCDPAGVLETFAGCGNAPVGELCECKERASGRICNRCKPLYWNLLESNYLGCEDCACHTPGTVGSLETCDTVTGICHCKPHVTARKCDECEDGTFNLMEDNLFGCTDCQCNIGGSNNNICDKVSGQCSCRHRIQGQRCDQPMRTHYFPTLYQYKYEIEDGRTPQNTPVRYGYDEFVFPGYSWRGYAVYSELQKKTLHDVYIMNPSLYRLIFSYRNPSNQVIKGMVTIIPENPMDDKQEVGVNFQPTNGPELMTVSTVNGFPLPFVMNPGSWTVAIDNTQSLFLDYMVFLPLAYYEATLLTKRVTTPSHIQSNEKESLSYAYPDISQFDIVYGSAGYVDQNGTRTSVELYENEEVLTTLNSPPMVWLGANYDRVQFDMRLKQPGKHVILLNYFTPRGGKATSVYISSHTQIGREKGRAVLYDCMYTWPCRQVVSDLEGKVAEFNFDSNYATIDVSIRGETGQDITLHSINVIPIEDWHMDFITPKPLCIMASNGQCVQSSFPHPPEATKVEFESNLEGKSADSLPFGVENTTTLVYLNASDPMVDVTGKLRTAGRYIFVVHYFQPNHPRINLDVLIQNGQFYEGILPLDHCPSAYGCRAIITHLDEYTNVFDILENFVLTLKQSDDNTIWLDYVLVIPEPNFSYEILSELPLDQTAEFFEKCGKNHFNIDPHDRGICREAAFALTAEYNNGAFPCQCHFQGSVSFDCEVFGGQCPCKPNVIGRECNQCRTGYFGFPDCRPCDCPSTALCDPLNGECICPPRVVGERCERCALNTYGFDPIIGCEECKCNELGVINGQLQCNLQTGQCQCRDNVVTRRCEKCSPGYWSFPFCQLCNCDLRGTEADICNQIDATCFCKANTEGPSCDICVPGTYNIDESNPDGCTKCFCFGKSQFCSTSNMVWSKAAPANGWQAVKLQFTETSAYPKLQSIAPDEYPNLIYMNLTQFYEPEKDGYVYLTAPISYYGNMIKSYGGMMSFKILTISDDTEPDTSAEGDIILQGRNITALYFYDVPLLQGMMNQVDIQFSERNFRTMEGVPMRREQFMQLLHKLDGIFIRAQYGSYSTQARLSDFKMETGSLNYELDSKRALSIEQCQCPPNYSGTSCENCAEGYFRTAAGPFGGFCVPCKCNNHADTCDPLTGQCINCRDNTVGFNCEKCAGGYFGDALKGTPYDCLICSCPLPSITNNFAISCELSPSEEEIECQCQEGYAGIRCDFCAPSYYGQPMVIGDYCKPCECNNNINVTSKYACDDISGLCLNCLDNTYGANCERCAPGYFGDAIQLKNCQRCLCDECGTRECQHYTGVCECHENVIGDKCNKCAPEYWGFASCQGCHACNCDIASESRQCDEETGQCKCRPGITGQRCDRCKPGYWKYSEYGCTECTCRTGFSIGVGCDPVTGHCSCLPGVIGDNCEGCPHRWALVEGAGCQECDECVHALLDTTEDLSNIIFPVIQEYESAAQSFFLHQRLQVINDTIFEVRPKVDSLDISDEELKPVEDQFAEVFDNAIAVSTKAILLNGRATGSAMDGLGVHNQALEVLDSIFNGVDLSIEIVNEINSMSIGLETGAGAKIELAINEAEMIVAAMKEIDFDPQNDDVRLDYEVAHEFLDRIRNLSLAGIDNQGNVDDAVFRFQNLQDQVEEMELKIKESNDKIYKVDIRNKKSRADGLDKLKEEHAEIERLGKETDMKINDAQNFTSLAKMKLDEVGEIYPTIELNLITLTSSNANMNESLIEMATEFEVGRGPADEAIQHSYELRQTANELDNLLSDTRHVTEYALQAANAYDNIVSGIDGAMIATMAAQNASEQAVELSSGLSEDALTSVEASEDIYGLAESKLIQVENVLLPQLNDAQLEVQQIEAMNDFANENLDNVARQLDGLDSSSLGDESRELEEEAMDVYEEAEKVNEQVNNQYESLQSYGDVARMLSKNIGDAKRDTKLALNQVENVDKKLPGMQQTAQELLSQKTDINIHLKDIGDRIEKLRRTITKTREKTNKIKVGIDFDQGSVLELQNPEDLSETATATELSLFIRTYERSGLPLFLGTPVGGSNKLHRTSTDDFMAIELDEGYVRLTTNLGAGAQSLVNNKFVSDNQWHKIYVKRIGKVVQLSVHSEDENKVENVTKVETELRGTYSILNLDPKVSKLYVGGIPAGVDVDSSLMNTYYSGQIEDLWINKRPIGLWNFVSRGSTDFQLKGTKERIVLKKSKATAHVLRFDGSGYIKVDTKGHETTPELSAVISFKTFAEDGLIYLLENGENEYVSLEIRGGKVVYQHKFGAATASLQSDGVYNDDEWHTIEATRVRGDAVMKIDSSDFKQSRSEKRDGDFSNIPQDMYFGGYPGEHYMDDITNEDFRGCIRDVRITDVTVDFARSKESIGTVPGCSVEAVTLVSFQREFPGYAKLSNPEGSGLQLVFKFKTQSPNGLLFYTETSDRSIYLSLSLAEGALVLRSAPGGEISTGTYTKYNDSEWHIVIATRENNELRLDIDDFESFSDSLVHESVPFDGPVFFGGLPEYYSISAAAAATDTNFFGCMGDATLNGKIIDFASAGKSDRPGAMLETCLLTKDNSYVPGEGPEPKYPPVHELSKDRETDGSDSSSTESYTPFPFFTFTQTDPVEEVTAPLDSCALPTVPMEDPDVSPENGLRFGSRRDSRIEFNELPDNIRGDFIFSVEFRTQNNYGIIFYAASISHRDFVTIYMNDGKIAFSFNPGSSPAIMRSWQRYNNNEWHKLVAHRTGNSGRLEIDGFIVANASIPGQAKHIDHQSPYYFGGLVEDIIELASGNTEQTFLSFNGCLRNFRMNNRIVGGQRQVVSVRDCSYQVEPGIFFGEGKLSHAVVRLNFLVGSMFDIYMEVKPRKNNGVLMSVHGRRDFILLQIINGTVEVKVDNGKGIIVAQFITSNQFGICDGDWHSIKVIKNKQLIVLIVDGVSAEPASGPLGSSSADTNKPLFIGSQPRLANRRGEAVKEKYVGCLKNLVLNGEQVDLAYILFVGKVTAGVCPLI